MAFRWEVRGRVHLRGVCFVTKCVTVFVFLGGLNNTLCVCVCVCVCTNYF